MKVAEALEARIPQRDIGQLYDRAAGVYDLWGALTEVHARNRALDLAGIQDGERVLEVATGTGLALREIVRRNPHGRNFGIDLSRGMLRKAEARLGTLGLSNYTLQLGTAFDLPFEDESIDVLVNNYMFDLIPFADMGRVVSEFHRVLRRGGRLILVNMTEGEGWGTAVYAWLYRLSPRLMGGCRGVTMAPRLSQHGFEVEVREYHQQALFPSEVIRAHRTERGLPLVASGLQ